MILFYNMMPEDYLGLFIHGRQNDATELARFRAVVRTIQAFQAGLLTREQVLEELKSRGEELGVYSKIDPEQIA